jgi:hypothetical protein
MPFRAATIYHLAVNLHSRIILPVEGGIMLSASLGLPESDALTVTSYGASLYGAIFLGSTESPRLFPLIQIASGYFGRAHQVAFHGRQAMDPSTILIAQIQCHINTHVTLTCWKE